MIRFTLPGILAMVASVLGTTAQAQGVRHPRPAPPLHLTVKLSERTRPYQPANDAGAPAVSADAVLSMPQGPVSSDALARLERAATRTAPQTLLDHASALATQQRYHLARSVQLATAVEAARDPGSKARLHAELQDATKQAKQLLLLAVKTYKALVDDDAHRNFPRMDEALFGFGKVLEGGRYFKEARLVFDKLLKSYPSSPYAAKAHLAFADHFFELGQHADAEARYMMVLRSRGAQVSSYATYKLGWTYLRLQRYENALESFYQVVTSTRRDAVLARLHRAAKLDFVRAFAEIGRADKAYPAFQRVDEAASLEMLEELARLYLVQARLDRAIFTHRELISLAPASPRVCAWQYAVARATLAGGTRAEVTKEIESLAKLRSALIKKQALPGPEADECRANTEAMVGEVGRSYHQEALKTLDRDTMAYAARLYRIHLDELPAAADRAEVLYLNAELSWSLAEREPDARLRAERWERTAAAFGDLAASGSHEPQRIRDAAHAAALAWMNALDIDPDVTAYAGAVDFTRPPPPPAAARPIAAREQQMIDAFDAYAGIVRDPKRAELGRMRFLQATIYRRHAQFERSVPLLAELLRSQRDTVLAESAARLLLDSLLQQQKIDEMLLLADQLAADTAFLAGKSDLKQAVDLIRSRSLRRR